MSIEPVNWQRITLQLRAKYKPLSVVAKEVSADWRTLNRLARGEAVEPRYSVGVRLLELHKRVMSTRGLLEFYERKWRESA